MRWNVVKSIQEKLIKDALKNAEAFLNDLDLDKDGIKDIDELKGFLQSLQEGIGKTVESIDAKKVTQAIAAAEVIAAAAGELAAIGKDVIDSEQFKDGTRQLQEAVKTAIAFAKDIAESAAKR